LAIDDLPNPIKEALLNEANGIDNYEAMPNSYHITELVGCIRKAYFRKTLPKKPINLETANNFHRGKLWDKDFCSRFRHNQIRVTYRCQKVPISISGHFDFLNQDDPQNPVITDLKAPKTLFYIERDGKPSEHYRQQVLFYCYCTAISKGAVMYWDGAKPLTFPIEVTTETCNKLIEELETKSSLLYFAIKSNKSPPRQCCNPESWECSYCEFSLECKKDE
jgi:hypothetical protein